MNNDNTNNWHGTTVFHIYFIKRLQHFNRDGSVDVYQGFRAQTFWHSKVLTKSSIIIQETIQNRTGTGIFFFTNKVRGTCEGSKRYLHFFKGGKESSSRKQSFDCAKLNLI